MSTRRGGWGANNTGKGDPKGGPGGMDPQALEVMMMDDQWDWKANAAEFVPGNFGMGSTIKPGHRGGVSLGVALRGLSSWQLGIGSLPGRCRQLPALSWELPKRYRQAAWKSPENLFAAGALLAAAGSLPRHF